MEKSIEAFRSKVNECLATATKRYGVRVDDVTVSMNLTGGDVLGKGGYFGGTHNIQGWGVLFNVQNLFHNWDDMVNDTVPHEVAHLVCIRMGWGKGHCPKWRAICRELGGTGRRCAPSNGFYVHTGGSFRYVGTYGNFYNFSKTIHNKIQNGQPRRFRDTKEVFTARGYVGYVTPEGTFHKRSNYDEVVTAMSGRSTDGNLTDKEQFVLDRVRKVYTDRRRALIWAHKFADLGYKIGIKNQKAAEQFVVDTVRDHF